MTATQTPPLTQQTVSAVGTASRLEHRFILTGVDLLTLVFPAIWVAEIVRIERSQILELPFYDPVMAGIFHHNGRVIPLVNTARLLKAERVSLPERLLAVVLNDAAGKIANIGLSIDRAIGSTTRSDLPTQLFDLPTTTVDGMLLMHQDAISTDLWQPRS